MPDPDPRDTKILADILALVLDTEPGQSAAALEALRRRAQARSLSGGALKNLFLGLSAGAGHPGDPAGAQGRVRGLNAAIVRLRTELDQVRAQLLKTETALAEARHQRAAMQSVRDRLLARRRLRDLMAAGGGVAGAALLSAGFVVWWTRPPAPPERPVPAASAVAGDQDGDHALDSALGRLHQALDRPLPPPPAAPMPQAAQQALLGHLKQCWDTALSRSAGDRFPLHILLRTDAGGVVRNAMLAADDQPRMADPAFRAFADAVLHAMLEPGCAALPLPAADLGAPRQLQFRFVP